MGSSGPQSPPGDRPSSTQEIPVAAAGGATAPGRHLPPHPDAVAPTPVPAPEVQPTGPVDFVPGLSGPDTPPVPPPGASAPPPPVPAANAAQASAVQSPAVPPPGPDAPGGTPSWPDTLGSGIPVPGRPRRRLGAVGSSERGLLGGLGLAALAVVLVLLGTGLRFGAEAFWSAIPLWSAFATACAALGLLAFLAAAANRLGKEPAERLVAGGLAGLAVFWVLVVLADVATDRGFVFTAALACLGGALWIGPRPRT